MSHAIDRPVKPNGRPRIGCWEVTFLAASVFAPLFAATDTAKRAEPVKNPHGDALLCDSCHISGTAGKSDLLYAGNVSKLCRSCHDGRLAAREGHPSDVKPTAVLKQAMSSGLGLEDGTLTCLTCHDVASRCMAQRQSDVPNSFFLRWSDKTDGAAFCFRCHESDDYQPFNAHDQIDAGRVRQDVCKWCHVGVPDVEADAGDEASRRLHGKSYGVCENCHSMAPHHPTEDEHMGMTPSSGMRSYMAAYEIKYRMNVPFPELLEYVAASGRKSRQAPLDADGRITCYTCHNPHEKDLLPAANPRSVGAEGDKAANHRLRVREDVVCRACHYK